MTVQELIDALTLVKNKNRIVILQKDAEGNGYNYCSGIDDNTVYQDDDYEISCSIEKLTPQLRKQGFSSSDVKDGKPAVVIFPG